MTIRPQLKNSGFSLLELVLAIAVFSVGSVAMATLLIDSNLSTKLSMDRTEALFYAKEGIEAVRIIRDNNYAGLINGNHGLVSSDTAWTFNADSSDSIENGKYTRVIRIIDTVGSAPATSSKTVISTVSWALTPERTASVSLTTLLTNWRNI